MELLQRAASARDATKAAGAAKAAPAPQRTQAALAKTAPAATGRPAGAPGPASARASPRSTGGGAYAGGWGRFSVQPGVLPGASGPGATSVELTSDGERLVAAGSAQQE